jgi:hypothetical protein
MNDDIIAIGLLLLGCYLIATVFSRGLPPKPKTGWSGRTEMNAKDLMESKSFQDTLTTARHYWEGRIEAAVLSERAEGDRLLREGPRAASCYTYQGHDYNAAGVCVRGCGIPEEGFVHKLQHDLHFAKTWGDRRVAEIKRSALAVTAFDVNAICERHKHLRNPICGYCQLAARIEELREVIRSGQ